MYTYVNKLKDILLTLFFGLQVFGLCAQSGTNPGVSPSLQEGGQLILRGDYEEAMVVLVRARERFDREEQWEESAQCHNLILETLILAGEMGKARDWAQKLESHYQARLDSNSLSRTVYLLRMGEILLNQGDVTQARGNISQAIQKLESKFPDQMAERAEGYASLGLVYWNSGDWETALEYLNRALDIRRGLFSENHPEVAAAYNDIGLVYSSLGKIEEARNYYEKARKIYQEVYPSNHPKTANIFINLSFLDRQNKEYLAARQNVEQALKIWESLYEDEHPRIAFAYVNLGQLYLEQGDFFTARGFLKQARVMYEATLGPKHPELANTLNLLGSLELQDGEYKTALGYFQQAFQANVPNFTSQDVDLNPGDSIALQAEILLNTFVLKARTLEDKYSFQSLKRYDLINALDALEKADNLLTRIRRIRTNRNDKIRLGNAALEVYERAIRICVLLSEVSLKKKEYQEKAFYFAERSKTSVLLSAISEANAKKFANIPKRLLEQEKDLKAQIVYYQKELAQADNAEDFQKAQTRLFELNRDYEAFVNKLESSFPAYYNLKYSLRTASVASVQAALAAQTEMISYFWSETDKILYVFYIGPDHYRLREVYLEQDIGRLTTRLVNTMRYRSSRGLLNSGTDLYDLLFPAQPHRGTHNLIIIPNGTLSRVPFELLLTQAPSKDSPVSDWHFMIKDYNISYHYSATLFEQIPQAVSQPDKGGIMLCAPVSFQRPDLNDLPGSRTEVEHIYELFTRNGQYAALLLEDKADEGFIKSDALKNYQYIHFATHGTVNEEQPEFSQLFLRPGESGQEDGNLYTAEIYNLDLNADLLAMSACQTGLGKVAQGEGIIGLSRAWIYAGARNLLVSLWAVSDASTAKLMESVYVQLLNDPSLSFSAALRKAKLELIKDPEFSLPFYWAAFILIGTPSGR